MSIRTQVTCRDIWPIYPDMKAYNSWNTEVHKIKHGQVHSKSIKDSKTMSWLNTIRRRPTNHINLLIHSNKAHPHTLVTTYGCFRKWWYPQIIHFNRDFHYKSSILGHPYFRKHPYVPGKMQNMKPDLNQLCFRAVKSAGFPLKEIRPHHFHPQFPSIMALIKYQTLIKSVFLPVRGATSVRGLVWTVMRVHMPMPSC